MGSEGRGEDAIHVPQSRGYALLPYDVGPLKQGSIIGYIRGSACRAGCGITLARHHARHGSAFEGYPLLLLYDGLRHRARFEVIGESMALHSRHYERAC